MKNPQKVKKVSLSSGFGICLGFLFGFDANQHLTLPVYQTYPTETKKVFWKYQLCFVLIGEFTIPIFPAEQ